MPEVEVAGKRPRRIHYTISQKMELVPVDRSLPAGLEETQEAAKQAREEEKVLAKTGRAAPSRPWGSVGAAREKEKGGKGCSLREGVKRGKRHAPEEIVRECVRTSDAEGDRGSKDGVEDARSSFVGGASSALLCGAAEQRMQTNNACFSTDGALVSPSCDRGGRVEPKAKPGGSSVQGLGVSETDCNQLVVSNIIDNNWGQVTSLRSVGSLVWKCLEQMHCKPSTMADSFHTALGSSKLLACASTPVDPLEDWKLASCMALDSLAGVTSLEPTDPRAMPREKAGVCQQLERFDVWGEECTAVSFDRFFSSRSIDYQGDEVKLAQRLNWSVVSPSLPEGVGQLNLVDFCTLGTKQYVSCFEEFLLPIEDQFLETPPLVMVEEGQWEPLCKGLLDKKICSILPLKDAYHVNGSPVLNGLFAVGKGEYVGNIETQRLIMNLAPVNSLCRNLRGDVGTPMLASMNCFLMEDHEVLLMSSEDARCFFCLFSTPPARTAYMGFNKLIPDSLLPADLKGTKCVLASRVLPMGFANSVGIAQHIHRNIVQWSCGEQW